MEGGTVNLTLSRASELSNNPGHPLQFCQNLQLGCLPVPGLEIRIVAKRGAIQKDAYQLANKD